ncbi:MAG: hypothetical protein HYZ44_07600 [Bacteroidetes bacterium]|nr:hypothetical protein [Bacteroidota bacterium]
MKRILVILLTLTLVLRIQVSAQTVPLEIFAGDSKATLDLLLMRNLKRADETKSHFLFFTRSSVTLDYKENSHSNLPQFALTEALSYNIKSWKGFAPVTVVQIFNRGTFLKAGIQYLRQRSQFTLFSWAVSDLSNQPAFDIFVVTRFTPAITDKLHLYSQLELLNSWPTQLEGNTSYTQRIRFGIKQSQVQFGLAMDLTEVGKEKFTSTLNTGLFLRYEF